jgi:apolipoprotein N-acyltransferase
VLGQNHFQPTPRLPQEAQQRGIAWLFGTEGGAPGRRYFTYNLVRGEVAGRPSFLQAKTDPMPFGERMPGPAPVRAWLDAKFGYISQEAGELSPASGFRIPTSTGDLVVHPLICSEALLPNRVREGVALTGADLLTNHTNDGWFERSPATDLHAIQVRLRAVELGLPLIRTTLTGKSGLFREDGRTELWGEAMSEAAKVFELTWNSIQTPARSAWLFRILLGGLMLGGALSWRRS